MGTLTRHREQTKTEGQWDTPQIPPNIPQSHINKSLTLTVSRNVLGWRALQKPSLSICEMEGDRSDHSPFLRGPGSRAPVGRGESTAPYQKVRESEAWWVSAAELEGAPRGAAGAAPAVPSYANENGFPPTHIP